MLHFFFAQLGNSTEREEKYVWKREKENIVMRVNNCQKQN